MGNPEKIRAKILSGADNNLSFNDLLSFVRTLGLRERKGKGGHANIFIGTGQGGRPIFLNLQTGESGKAKPYQVEQVRNVILEHFNR